MKVSFRSMGTEIVVLAGDDADAGCFAAAVRDAAGIFAREEARFSRFRDGSELTRVNAAAGTWMQVSGPFVEVVGLALAGAEDTNGLFDPTVLRALEAAGYDRDFAAIDRRETTTRVRPVPGGGRWREVELEATAIRLPADVGIDLGGLVKGWTADLAAEASVASGLPWAIVNAGGDLRVAGGAPRIDVGIEEPEDPTVVACVVGIEDGALATTSVTRRRWGPELHHVIDPRTGLPARTPVAQATVWGSTCAAAEIASKRALIAGTAALDELAGVLVLASGEIVTNLLEGAAA